MCFSVLKTFLSSCSIQFEYGEHIRRCSSVWCPPIRSTDGGPLHLDFSEGFLEYFRHGFSRPPLPPWLRCCCGCFPGILPAFALGFSFPLLTASAELLFFLRGEESWVVEFVSGIKRVALVSRVASPSGVVDVLPGTSPQGICQHCGVDGASCFD